MASVAANGNRVPGGPAGLRRLLRRADCISSFFTTEWGRVPNVMDPLRGKVLNGNRPVLVGGKNTSKSEQPSTYTGTTVPRRVIKIILIFVSFLIYGYCCSSAPGSAPPPLGPSILLGARYVAV